MFNGECSKSEQKAMQILVVLGKIYGAEKMISVTSVQIAGVSYSNLGEAGLEFLEKIGEDGRVKVLTTLNPAGMDLENYKSLGISEDFADKQRKVIDAFKKMGVDVTCTCTPYLIGNKPKKGDHIAWSESSAVCYANSVLGARTNREGGPSAIAAALTGKTPEYGMHLEKNRQAQVRVKVEAEMKGTERFGLLGKIVGEKIGNKIPYFVGIKTASTEELKSLCASIATYGGTAMFHIEGITPNQTSIPIEQITVKEDHILKAEVELNDQCEVDFVSIGCPHCTLEEIMKISNFLRGKKVTKEAWITVARPIKKRAEDLGYIKAIEDSGAKIACDTCCVVAPIKGRFKCLATDSAKGCFYGVGKNNFKVKIMSFEKCLEEMVR